jgi:nitrite reductase/ring-hydroxylating ferredoxin subunit
LQTDQLKLLHIDGKRVVLGKTAEGYVAFDDRCTHKGGSLAGGMMICGTVQCPWHGSQFNGQTGKVKAGPAKEDIQTYPTTIREGRVYLSWPKKTANQPQRKLF